MHLLATEPGIIADGSAAIDLAQTPGDIIVLASADTEIALLAAAQARRRADDPQAPTLRLAPVMRLGHNFSVDLYMETVARARLVIARLLGGSAYWPYGVERLVETCRDNGIPLALLPGDDKPDPELARLSTVPADACRRLWRYLAEGGPGNADNFLRLCGEPDRPRGPLGPNRRRCCAPGCTGRGARRRASPRSRPDGGAGEGSSRSCSIGRSCSPATRRRSMRWCRRWPARGLRPLPVFVSSLKEDEAAALLADILKAHPPAVILNATGFSLAASGGGDPLRADCPVLQIVFSGGDEESWRDEHARPRSARSGDERGVARDRRAHPVARRVVQGAARPRCGNRGRSRRLSAGRRPGRLCRRSGAQLGAAARQAASRAAGRDRARELPEPRRPYRQRGRARYAGIGRRDPEGVARGRIPHRRYARRTAPR